jgi:hypothetical protein
MRDRDRAKEKFGLIKKNWNKCLIIHYSCESFSDKVEGYSPRISSIAIKNLGTGQVYSFAIHKSAEIKKYPKAGIEDHYDELEHLMLDEYFDFIKGHRDYYFIHWNMRDINYGFEAIKQRYKVLGGTPVEMEPNNLFDLSGILINFYGSHYIGHPRMQKLIETNSISTRDMLTGAQEAEAFENKEYIALHHSTVRKVDIFANILNRFFNKSLKTNVHRYAQTISDVYEHWLFKLITIMLALWGLISGGIAIYSLTHQASNVQHFTQAANTTSK